MHPWLLPSPHPSVLAMSTLPSPAFSRLMVQAACPGTAGSRGDAGGSSVVRGRAGCWPSSSKTCACRVKRAAGLPGSLCHPTGCAPPAPRPQVTHTVRAQQGRSHVPTLYCQEELSRLPSGLPVTRWCLCAGWASARPQCLKIECKVLGLFQLLHQRKTQKEGGEEYGKGQRSPGCCVMPHSPACKEKKNNLFLMPPVKKKKESAGEVILQGNGTDQLPALVKSSPPFAALSGDGRPRRSTAAAARSPQPARAHGPGGPFLHRPKRRFAERLRPEAERQEDAQPAGHPTPLQLAPAPRPRSNAKNAGLPVPPPAPPRSRAVLTLRGQLPARAGRRHGTGFPGSATPRRPRGERLGASQSSAVPAPHPGPAHRRPADKGKPGPARPRPLPVPSRCRSPAARSRSVPRPGPAHPSVGTGLLRPGSLPWQRPGPPTDGGAWGMHGPTLPLSTPQSPTLPLSAPYSPP